MKTKDIRGSKNPKWKGGKTRDGKGRFYLYRPDHPNANRWGYVYRYRLVAEEMIGRSLRSSEIVHHKDGNPSNDAPENLEIMEQGAHLLLHRAEFEARRIAAYRASIVPRFCDEPGCTRKHCARGFCSMHYKQMKSKGVF